VEHLAGVSFAQDQLDLGERQLAFSLAFDADVDNFAAAVGFARQACIAVSAESGEFCPAPS
jgi:dynactin 1